MRTRFGSLVTANVRGCPLARLPAPAVTTELWPGFGGQRSRAGMTRPDS